MLRRPLQRHPPTHCIAIDIDGTLLIRGELNQELLNWCKQRKLEGFSMVLWSARGEAYAREVAKEFNLFDYFDHVVSKPGYIVDDKGWSWVKYTRVIPIDEAITGPSGA